MIIEKHVLEVWVTERCCSIYLRDIWWRRGRETDDFSDGLEKYGGSEVDRQLMFDVVERYVVEQRVTER